MGLNWSGGLDAVAKGLGAMAERKYREADREWEKARLENLEALRHKNDMESESTRAANNAAEGKLNRTHREKLNTDDNAARIQAAKDADASAERRHRESLAASKSGENNKADRLRESMSKAMQGFKKEENEITDLLLKAQEGGDPSVIARQQGRLNELIQERNSAYQQYTGLLADAGDPWAIGQRINAEDAAKLKGGNKPAIIPGETQRPPASRIGAPKPPVVEMVPVGRGGSAPRSVVDEAEAAKKGRLSGPGRGAATRAAYEQQQREDEEALNRASQFRIRQGVQTGRGGQPKLIQ